jgi:hypothetical protein
MIPEQIESQKISSVHPFGDLNTATILIIGHDPRLQHSQAEAEYPFFFEYLKKYPSRPTYGPDSHKYALAHAVWDYVCDLAGRPITLDQLFITNLCNKFLPSAKGGGTVLIPDPLALRGVIALQQIISEGNFNVILPMSVQVFYHLCRLGFLDEKNGMILAFMQRASPVTRKANQGVYVTSGKAPFLEVCGQLFHHSGIPLIPILHVKQWPLGKRTARYLGPMNLAKSSIMTVLAN